MRDYGQVSPRFWTGATGKKLRGHQEAQLVALYLQTAPGSHMIGMYPLEIPTLCHHIGLSTEGACKGLARLSEVGFAHYDSTAELVWVPEMAAFQIEDRLKRGDKRIRGVEKELENYRNSRFFNAFIDRYEKDFNLGIERNSASPTEAPSEPLRSQEQEQEQDQEQEKKDPASGAVAPPPLLAAPVAATKAKKSDPTPEQWACRKTIRDHVDELQVRFTGQRFVWNAQEQAAVVTLSRLGGKDGTSATEGLKLIDVFVERMAGDAFYAKNFRPSYIASQINALRMPVAITTGRGVRASGIPAASPDEFEKAKRDQAARAEGRSP